jgi:hypothetical protein
MSDMVVMLAITDHGSEPRAEAMAPREKLSLVDNAGAQSGPDLALAVALEAYLLSLGERSPLLIDALAAALIFRRSDLGIMAPLP